MENIFGKPQAKTISGLTLNRNLALLLEVLFLLGIGAVAILLHARLRTPLNIPGHHGIEFMALLLLGRMTSNLRFASTISSIGIGLLLLFPAFGFHDPMMGFNYMLPGFFLDTYYQLGGKYKKNVWFLGVAAGLSFITIPFSRLIISASTGYPYGAFIKHGLAAPFFSYLFFGLLGGFFGTGISKIFNKLLAKFSA
jgi:hypothetical protein